jgi:hypothetical protein
MERSLALLTAAVLSLAFATADTAAAGSTSSLIVAQASQPPASAEHVVRAHRRPTRITVYPIAKYYRECTDWYELQHRPSGDVIYPQMSCHWVAR